MYGFPIYGVKLIIKNINQTYFRYKFICNINSVSIEAILLLAITAGLKNCIQIDENLYTTKKIYSMNKINIKRYQTYKKTLYFCSTINKRHYIIKIAI